MNDAPRSVQNGGVGNDSDARRDVRHHGEMAACGRDGAGRGKVVETVLI